MRVLVCGDRNWDDLRACEMFLRWVGPNDTCINGMAKGADTLGAFACTENGAKLDDYPANWELFGKRAGPLRNAQMLQVGKPDVVIAFHDDLGASKGTRDMVQRAKEAGVPVYLISRP